MALAHRHRRPQPADGGDRRPLEAAGELPGEGRQGFQEAPLAFPEQGIKGQRGLPGTGHSGHHGQAGLRNGQVEALEVVLLRALNDDLVAQLFLHVAPVPLGLLVETKRLSQGERRTVSRSIRTPRWVRLLQNITR